MKIVINIDENILNDAKNGHVRLGEIADAVLNGTPLPKGHGRLIDADTLNTRCVRCNIDCAGDCDRCSDNVVSAEDIRRALTVIDADDIIDADDREVD